MWHEGEKVKKRKRETLRLGWESFRINDHRDVCHWRERRRGSKSLFSSVGCFTHSRARTNFTRTSRKSLKRYKRMIAFGYL
jgi:hypothetical protein